MAEIDRPLIEQEMYYELTAYTLTHADPAFIHQYVVDAYAAQHADEHSKPIYAAFALAGLYLHLERGYSGRAVQRAHMQLAKKKQAWPRFTLPTSRGEMTAVDVMRPAPGRARDEAINQWSASVWAAWSDSHEQVARWVKDELGI